MKNQLSNLGKPLNQVEQKSILGGKAPVCKYPYVACYYPTTRTWDCVPSGNCPT